MPRHFFAQRPKWGERMSRTRASEIDRYVAAALRGSAWVGFRPKRLTTATADVEWTNQPVGVGLDGEEAREGGMEGGRMGNFPPETETRGEWMTA